MDLSALSTLFIRLDEAEYEALCAPDTWSAVIAGTAGNNDALRTPPAYSDYRHFHNIVLTPGMPSAALPVESLYKEWCGKTGVLEGIAAGKGFYLGAPARHIRALCEQLEIDIPQQFQAMPDHLVLLIELYEFLCSAATPADAAQFAAEHLDWLGEYCQAIEQRVTNGEAATTATAPTGATTADTAASAAPASATADTAAPASATTADTAGHTNDNTRLQNTAAFFTAVLDALDSSIRSDAAKRSA